MGEVKKIFLDDIQTHAANMRKTILKMAYECGQNAHLGGGLSLVEVLAVLYGAVMNVTDSNEPYEAKDKFILSKGHGVLGLYAVLAEFGIIPEEMLSTFLADGSELIAHPVLNPKLGIEASTGSLGQGISIGVGMALAAKKKGYDYQTYVICGNGECNEGSVWEASMSACSLQLDNFVLYIDNNHMQSDGESKGVLDVSTCYAAMFQAMGFDVIEVDGHNINALYDAFTKRPALGMPRVIIGNTIKGKGVSFMENNPAWHHNRLTKEWFDLAMREIEESK